MTTTMPFLAALGVSLTSTAAIVGLRPFSPLGMHIRDGDARPARHGRSEYRHQT